MSSFNFDGFNSFDEETTLTSSRRPRPYRLSFAATCAALIDMNAPFQPNPPLATDLSDPLALPWLTLEDEVLTAIGDIRNGNYAQILSRASSSTSSYRCILSPVTSDEWPNPAPSDFATPETVAQAGGAPSLSDSSFITSLFSKRVSRYVAMGEGDDYFIDIINMNSPSPPRAWRALLVSTIATASLALFTQANVTGPELSNVNDIANIYPQPWAASLLPIAEVLAAEKATNELNLKQIADSEAARERSQWQAEDKNTKTDTLTAATTTVTSNNDEEDEGLSFLSKTPRIIDPLTKYSLLSLSPPGGDEVYALLQLPHFLTTARFLLAGSVRPIEGGSTAVSISSALEMRSGAIADPRIKALYDITDGISAIHWLTARATLAHSQALLGRETHGLLWKETAGLYRRIALLEAPDVAIAFTERDIFRRRLVATQLAQSGAQDREMGDLPVEGDNEEESKAIETANARENPTIARPYVAHLLLEWGLAQHASKRAAGAKTSFFLAKRETALLTSLSGASGKRTKFQLFNTIQLVLNAASTGAQADIAIQEATDALARGAAVGRFSNTTTTTTGGGEDVVNVDAVTGQAPPSFVLGGVREVKHSDVDGTTELLENIALVDGAGTDAEKATRHELFYSKGWGKSLEHPVLPPSSSLPLAPAIIIDAPISTLDQCVVLALCLDVANHNPADGLTNEEMKPYAARVIDTPLNWHVHSTALYVRALLEFENHRTMDRACLQLQALADQYTTRLTATQARQSAIDAAAQPKERLAYVTLLAFPARWELQRVIADKYRKLGAVRSALAVYEELELWEDVVECLALLEKPRRAEKLLRQLLLRAPSPRLYCLLGAITDSDEPYQMAWELSGRKYAKAAFALGRRCVEHGFFEQAAEHLRIGIRLAPHDEAAHFLAGILAMRFERFTEALSYFSRVVQSDPNRADAWSNIAAIQCHQEKWDMAYAAVTEAMKQDRRDWRLLNNAVLAAVRSKHYSRSLSLQIQLVNFRLDRPPGLEGDEGGTGLDMALLAEVVDVVLASGDEERRLALATANAEDSNEKVAAASTLPSINNIDASILPAQPSSLDFDDDVDSTSSSTTAPPPVRIHIDSAGNAAILYLSSTISTLKKIVSIVTPPPAVWLLLANVLFESGDEAGALDALLRHCRSLMNVAGWANGEKTARSRVIAASARYASLAKPADARAHASYVCSRLDAAAAAASLSAESIAAEGIDVARLRIIATGS